MKVFMVPFKEKKTDTGINMRGTDPFRLESAILVLTLLMTDKCLHELTF